MNQKDLSVMHQWAVSEDWTPGKYELDAFWAADPHNGYFLLEVDNEPVCSISAVQCGHNSRFGGLFICAPHKRKLGYGTLLWNFLYNDHLKDVPSIEGNASLQHVQRYSDQGWVPTYLTNRYEALVTDVINNNRIKRQGNFNLTNKFSFEKLIEYDSSILHINDPPYPRSAFLKEWIKMPESYKIVAENSQGKIVGYGVLSRLNNNQQQQSYKIAPLFSDNYEITKQIFVELCELIKFKKNAIVYISIGETLPYLKQFVDDFQLKVQDTMRRVYKGTPFVHNYDKLVGFTTGEIGD